ncbi:MAG: iron-sulfur cluster assembly scaffold protein [Chloroflexi bacterium]|nr:iron-sulfur cluster assembly scaffold protein [Chloroflexota bacterium]
MKDLSGDLSPVALDHCRHPRNAGEYAQPDGCGLASRPCGDTLQFCLRVREGRIAGARFMTNGCGPTVACGSVTTELVKGKTVTEALTVTEEDILKALEGLPESEVHCATLAADALRQAIRDYLSLQREPWKRSYRRVEPFPWGERAGSD